MARPIVVNQDILDLEYAVRGPIPQRAAEMQRAGRKIIPCHIGNPQALGQRPISFYREVLSLLEDPARIARERAGGGPSDYSVERAEAVLSHMDSGMGAYTESQGMAFIREAVAGFIDRRDAPEEAGAGPTDPASVFLTDGASEGARHVLELLLSDRSDGLMIPIPQYPLYSATIRRCGGTQVNYYPDEENGWSLDTGALEDSIGKARAEGINVKGIVVINPANPTGAILDRKSIEEVISFAERHGLVIIADEVYQDNVYGGEFFSFSRELGERPVPLFSLHSTSKGFYGECGHRGGYLQVRNPPPVAGTDLDFADVIRKLASVSLCSNTAGQVLTYLMVTPPEPGSSEHERFQAEKQGIIAYLHEKATRIRESLETMDGAECFGRIGAMYLFPRLGKMPAGKTDFDYCMALLESTGLCTVNGSGFGQKAGTSHLRIAFLPPRDVLEEVLPRWADFHNSYIGG